MFLKKIILLSLVWIFVVCSLQANEHDKTIYKMFKSSGLNIDYKIIESDKTVVIARKDQEKTDSAIALSMVLFVKAPFTEVLKTIKKEENRLSSYKNAKKIFIKDINNSAQYFKNISFKIDEIKDVEELFDYDGGNNFNLSTEEIKQLQKFKKSSNNKILSASEFYQYILQKRFEKYLKKGIEGIVAYEHCDKDATVEEGFKKSSFGMKVFRKNFPDLYRYYMKYPKNYAKNVKEKFYIIKDKIDNRVVFILKHQISRVKDNLVLIAERQFYISNSLDAIQTQILCTPYKKGTLVVLSSQSYTDKVAGFGRSVAVKIGRHMMEKQIRPMFEKLEKKFNKTVVIHR